MDGVAVERLQKILSNAGIASRRVAEEMILAGRVSVNGAQVETLGARADPEIDEVMVDGVPVLKGRYRYFALHKPAGFVTTARDDLGRETVLDLVPIGEIQLHPVGRLDLESEGLVILTSDGHLTDLLTHPRYEVEKEYLVGLDAMPAKRDMERLVRGIEDAGERLRAVSAREAAAPPKPMDVEIDFDDVEDDEEDDGHHHHDVPCVIDGLRRLGAGVRKPEGAHVDVRQILSLGIHAVRCSTRARARSRRQKRIRYAPRMMTVRPAAILTMRITARE